MTDIAIMLLPLHMAKSIGQMLTLIIAAKLLQAERKVQIKWNGWSCMRCLLQNVTLKQEPRAFHCTGPDASVRLGSVLPANDCIMQSCMPRKRHKRDDGKLDLLE